MKPKIYISLPITGRESTVKLRYYAAVEEIKDIFDQKHEDFEIVSPVDIDDFDDAGYHGDKSHDWAWYMGKDIEALLRCDYIFMTEGYHDSKGCLLEKHVAEKSFIGILYSKNADNSIIKALKNVKSCNDCVLSKICDKLTNDETSICEYLNI